MSSPDDIADKFWEICNKSEQVGLVNYMWIKGNWCGCLRLFSFRDMILLHYYETMMGLTLVYIHSYGVKYQIPFSYFSFSNIWWISLRSSIEHWELILTPYYLKYQANSTSFLVINNIFKLDVIFFFEFTPIFFNGISFAFLPPPPSPSILQKLLAWALIILLFSTLIFYQPTEFILGFVFLS